MKIGADINTEVNTKYRIVWPDWNTVLKSYLLEWPVFMKKEFDLNRTLKSCEQSFKQIKESNFFKVGIFGDTFLRLMEQINSKSGGEGNIAINTYQTIVSNYCKGGAGNEESASFIMNYKLLSNEFICVFDIDSNTITPVDNRVYDIIGIKRESFNLASLSGLDSENPLYHPEDLYHSLRFGALAYVVFSTPGVELRAFQDAYSSNFRINTCSSQIESVRKMKWLCIHKRAIPVDNVDLFGQVPRKYIFILQVRDQQQFNGINPFFGSSIENAARLNDLLYLYNAALLGVSPKFLLMIDERLNYERNKDVANQVNLQLKKYGIKKVEYTENQIADCFSKTIRVMISKVNSKWEMSEHPAEAKTDQDVVTISKKLGLLPMPSHLKDTVYKKCYEI